MVGRLIQKQDVRLREQQLHKGEAGLLPAAELVHPALQIALMEAEARKDAAQLALPAVAAPGLILFLQRGIQVQVLLAGIVRHGDGRFIEPLLQRLQMIEGMLQLLLYALPFIHERRLCEIADAHAVLDMDVAAVQAFLACDDLQQRCLATAVAPDHRDLFIVPDLKLNVAEDDTGTERL